MLSHKKRTRNSVEQRGSPYELTDTEERLKKVQKTHILQKEDSLRVPLPSLSSYLQIALGDSHWYARRSFKNIVVFGDSYSKSNEGFTWVDYLQRRMKDDPPKVYNFAVPAATAEDGLSEQLSRFFNKFPSKGDSNPTPPLDPDETVYIVFIGINDCGTTECDELEPIVHDIFDSALHSLYVRAGARNLILIDVPPVHRSPQAIVSECAEMIEDRVKTWNELLQAQTVEFGQSSNGVTIFLFSVHQALVDVLEDPLEYDFSEDDPADEGGNIWLDDLHLTSEVHDILAEQLLRAILGM